MKSKKGIYMPKISIITPAYNCEKYLPDAVKSVLSQTFTDWELLMIDDCSKDNTYRYMKMNLSKILNCSPPMLSLSKN